MNFLCFRARTLTPVALLVGTLLVALVGCGKQPADSGATEPGASSIPGGLPPPGGGDLRQLRYQITYERDVTLRSPHRGVARDIGVTSFRLEVGYDELVQLEPPPEGATWPTILPAGVQGPVNGKIQFSGTHNFIEDPGTTPSPPAILHLQGTFSSPHDCTVGLDHYRPYTDHYVAAVGFNAAVRGTLTGPIDGQAVVAGMMQAPFTPDPDDPEQLRLAVGFTVYPKQILPRPSGPEGMLHDMQAKAIPPTVTLGSLLGVAWRGAEMEGRPRGDWTYTFQGTHSSGESNETQSTDRVTLTIRTVPVTLAPPGTAEGR